MFTQLVQFNVDKPKMSRISQLIQIRLREETCPTGQLPSTPAYSSFLLPTSCFHDVNISVVNLKTIPANSLMAVLLYSGSLNRRDMSLCGFVTQNLNHL